MEKLAYKPNLAEVIERLRLLYQGQAEDQIFAEFEISSAVLQEFAQKYPGGFCEYPDPEERATFWDRLLAERAGLLDDSIPSAYLSEMDQGLYGGLFGGQVQFLAHPETGWISSMCAPLLGDWDQLSRLRLDYGHPWFHRYQHQLEVFVRHAAGKFAISHFILIDGLNFCFELVGATNTYLALLERPDWVRQAIELAFQTNVAVQELFFQQVPLLAGGTASNMVGWAPGRVVSESVDPFHMTSVQYFERWGREPVQRIFDHFDGGVLHLHANGRHLLEAVCTLRGLRAIFMGDDRGYPKAFDIIGELKRRAGTVPLVVQADFEPFVERLKAHSLPGGVIYKVRGAPGTDAVNRLMEKVRAYRA
ncbi:MAG: hypothetical protein NZ602_03125 [Thermoguttaceae bacterium]|nr:hypothetical protein [Thermoguttaceae bacterium]MDW8037365.1 hypothetical protein [Thermoguttaceae bacterium]